MQAPINRATLFNEHASRCFLQRVVAFKRALCPQHLVAQAFTISAIKAHLAAYYLKYK